MATVTAANGQVLQHQTLEGVLLAVLYMIKDLEVSGSFIQGEGSRLTLQTTNGQLSFNGSIKTASTFDPNGNVIATAVPYLSGTASAPNVTLQ